MFKTDMGCIGVVMALKHTLVVTGRGQPVKVLLGD